jgi:transposase-like protein
MKNKIDSSRRKTPWDDNKEISVTQKFIKEKYLSNYKIKHSSLSDSMEYELINSVEIKECKYCCSKKIRKRGFTSNKIQRYFCNDCKKTFTTITNTIFENHKIQISEWIEFILDVFYYGSTSLISKVNKNAINTTNLWLHKLFLILENWQNDIILEKKVYIDEMFYSVIKSDIETTSDGKKLRGLSKNQYCIGLGYDGKNIIAIVEGLGKTSTNKTYKTFKNHIKQNSKIIHDDEKSHIKLVNDLALIDENYNSLYLKTLDDNENPLRPINHQCDLIRQFLNSHSGFNRKDLQNYLNLYSFMNSGHKNKLEKVDEILNLAFKIEAKLSYRDFYNVKK